MMERRNRLVCALVASVGLWFGDAALAQHEGDIWIGRTSAGALSIGGYPVDSVAVELPAAGGFIHGWADNDPGFDRLVADEPENDLYRLDSGAQIYLVVVEMDPAFRLVDSGLNIVDDPGEETYLGGSSLHLHVTWNIDSDDADYDESQYMWDATFRLEDRGTTGYSPSAPFTLHFVNIDCPPGDVNGDAVVDVADVADFVDLLLDPTPESDEQLCSADANLDGVIDGEDIQGFVDRLLMEE